MKTINTSECENCRFGEIDEKDKRRIMVHCSAKNRDYLYGSRIPCDSMEKHGHKKGKRRKI